MQETEKPFTAEREDSKGRLGFMSGEISVPDDFDSMDTGLITALFEGREDGCY